MGNIIGSFYHWLHGKWPAGLVEPLPKIDEDGQTSVDNVYVVGDLTGIPLLKFASLSGANAIRKIVKKGRLEPLHNKDGGAKPGSDSNSYPLVIIGGGVSGYAAAMEATKQGIDFLLIESARPFSTIENFPKNKPIFTYPKDVVIESELNVRETMDTKEKLLTDLKQQVIDAKVESSVKRVTHLNKQGKFTKLSIAGEDPIYAQNVVVAIGKSGDYRKLGVTGEDKDKVVNRLHDPAIYKGKNVLVVGGGDSAIEAAIACSQEGANVTLSYRNKELTRPKEESLIKLQTLADEGKLRLELGSTVQSVADTTVSLQRKGEDDFELPNDAVLSLIGREAPLNFFKKSGIHLKNESTIKGWILFALFLVIVVGVYDWKGFGFLNGIWSQPAFPSNAPAVLSSFGDSWEEAVNDRSTLLGTVAMSMKSRSFYYTFVYTSLIGIFGIMRIRRRKTPYVKVQTSTLFLIQAIPLFILPEVVFPYMGYNGLFDAGWLKAFADSLFPAYISAEQLALREWPEWGHPRAYWHAYGFILAWPLNVYNVFTSTPIVGWLIISAIQTFVIIPALIYKFGKGAYCGWICSCGALAETVGDTQREKMPHGPFWNKLNMIGQVILVAAFVLLIIRILGWVYPESWMNNTFSMFLEGKNSDGALVNPISWKWTVDILLGGILGVGLYFKFSGRVWCRFACPLAALMHIYARFSKFRIFAKKEKCISCNMCTSVCHQGIDIMSFANKGKPMEDPQCVRCSACVQTCPTQVLSFGQIDRKTGKVEKYDNLIATSAQSQFVDASTEAKSA